MIDSSADKKFEQVQNLIRELFEIESNVMRNLISREFLRLEVDANGFIKNNATNMRIRAEILEKYQKEINQFIYTHAAPRDFEFEYLPNTTLGQATAFGAWYAKRGIRAHSPRIDMLVLENLQQSTAHVTSVMDANKARLRQVLTTAIITPGATYRQVQDQLQTDFGLRPNVAETVFRGTVMQTFRMSNAALMDEMNTELLQHTGPPPRPMPNGHEMCIAHYGEVHTLEEWKEIARMYEPQGGTDAERVLEWVGGYNCRHGLRPVSRSDFEGAREDQDTYKSLQQEYLNELGEENSDR